MGSQRILFRFSKEGEARFLSHHDLMRLFERALRRAELPVQMTQGFNPHPKLSVVLALPLGLEARDEALEVAFEPAVEPAEAQARLGCQLPAGLRLGSAEVVPDGARPRVESVAYEAELPPQCGLSAAEVEQFLARDAILVERPGRSGPSTLDIRPALQGMALEGRRLTFRLRAAERGTPKATEVVAELLGPVAASGSPVRLRRTRLDIAMAPRAPKR